MQAKRRIKKGDKTLNNHEIQIRVASAKDADGLLEIYAPYVEKTAITFEYQVPGLAEFQKRIEKT